MIWPIFERMARQQYEAVNGVWIESGVAFPYSVDDVLSVFAYFFDAYAANIHQQHPPLKREQVRKLIERMPFIDVHHDGTADLDADAYPVMIDRYFKTPFQCCDYHIHHFFAGAIREMRYYEELY